MDSQGLNRRSRHGQGVQCTLRHRVPGILAALLALGITVPAFGEEPAPARKQELIHLVRQDCGSCHGMQLTGGLGPALTPAALADKPRGSLVATIIHGRPGTPMPPWASFMRDSEAEWIVAELLKGFPEK